MADPLANLGVPAIPATPLPSAPANSDPLASLGVAAYPPASATLPAATAAPSHGVVGDLAGGFEAGAAKTVTGAMNLLGRGVEIATGQPKGSLTATAQTPTNSTAAQSVGEGAENVGEWVMGEEALKGLTELSGAGKYLKSAAAWSEYLKNSPKAVAAINLLGRLTGQAVIGGVQGGVKGAATGEAAQGATEDAASGAAFGALGEGMSGLASKLPGKLATGIEESGNRAANSILRAKGDRSFLYGKNPGNVIADEQIPVTNSIFKLKQSVGDAMNKLDGTVKAKLSDPAVANQKIDVAKIANGAVDDALKELQGRQGVTNRKGIVEALNNLRPGMHDADGNLIARISRNEASPTAAQEYKKNIGKSTKWNGLGADPEIAEFVNNTRKAIYGRLNDAVEQVAPGTKALNMRFANAIEANRLLEQRITREEMNDLGYGKLVKKLGTKGAMLEAVTALGLGHPIAAVPGAIVAANEAARTTAARIMRARSAEGAADLVRKAAPTIAKAGKAVGGAMAPLGVGMVRDNDQEGSALAGNE
jgi:hypothetical protein